MNDKIITVRTFGQFAISYHGQMMTMQEMKSNKLILLFVYFLNHQKDKITSEQIIRFLWAYEDIDSPTNALKNLVYRLRTILKKGLGLEGVIKTGRGSYHLNPDFTFDVDAFTFKDIVDHQEDYTMPEYYVKALSLYRGDYLSELNGDRHIVVEAMTYRQMATTLIFHYAHYLEEHKDYLKMIEVAKKGSEYDQTNESLYALWIKGLYLNRQYEEAGKVYTAVVDHFYHTLGTYPSEELQSLYALIQKETHTASSTIIDVMKDLEDCHKTGTMYVEYGTFRTIVTLQSRVIDRVGLSSYICLVTVKYYPEDEKGKRYLCKTMDDLKTTFVSSLRTGDVICRYSYNQYVVMLTMCNYEDACQVMNRVTARINRNLNNKGIALQLAMQEVK